MNITDEKKEEIKQAADIVEVVGDHVRLKRSGSGYMGLCPFHNENTPSFHVAPHLGSGIYKCFGCGRTGDVVQFMMELEGVGFLEAMKSLADRYNIHLPEEEEQEFDPQYQLREGVFHALRFAAVYFYRVLKEQDESEEARRYLKDRGFTEDTIKKYGLGYSLDRWDGLITHAQSAGINLDYLREGGLIKENQNGTSQYDTFRGRVMFPIFNANNRVVAFGGRILKKDEKTAKYINSPATVVYNKSEALYGIQVAKNEIRRKGEAILVEGYTDVLALHQAGFKNSISTSGTSLTAQQLKIIHKYGDELLMIFDADDAGQNAMQRGLNLALSEGLTVQLLQLPDNEDPDTFIKQYGSESFQKLMNEKAEGFLQFLVRKAKSSKKWENPQQQRDMIADILRSIALIDDSIERETLVMSLSQLTGIGDRSLFEQLDILKREVRKEQARRQKVQQREEMRQRNSPVDQRNPARGSQSPDARPNPDINDVNQELDMAGQQQMEEGGVDFGMGNRPSSEEHRKQNDREGPQGRRPAQKVPGYEKEIIRLMLQYPKHMIEYIGSKVNRQFFKSTELADFFDDIIERYQDDKPVSIDYYTGRENPYPRLVGDVFLEAHGVSPSLAQRGMKIEKDESSWRTAKGALKSMYLAHYDFVLSELRDELHKVLVSDDLDDKEKRHKKAEINHTIKETAGKREELRKMNLDAMFAEEDPEEEEESKNINFRKIYLDNDKN